MFERSKVLMGANRFEQKEQPSSPEGKSNTELLKNIQSSFATINRIKAEDPGIKLSVDYQYAEEPLAKAVQKLKTDLSRHIERLRKDQNIQLANPGSIDEIEKNYNEAFDRLNETLEKQFTAIQEGQFNQAEWDNLFEQAKQSMCKDPTEPNDADAFKELYAETRKKLDAFREEEFRKECQILQRSAEEQAKWASGHFWGLQSAKKDGYVPNAENLEPKAAFRPLGKIDEEQIKNQDAMAAGENNPEVQVRKNVENLQKKEGPHTSASYPGCIFHVKKNSINLQVLKESHPFWVKQEATGFWGWRHFKTLVKSLAESIKRFGLTVGGEYILGCQGLMECLKQKFGLKPGDEIVISYDMSAFRTLFEGNLETAIDKIHVMFLAAEKNGLCAELEPSLLLELETLRTTRPGLSEKIKRIFDLQESMQRDVASRTHAHQTEEDMKKDVVKAMEDISDPIHEKNKKHQADKLKKFIPPGGGFGDQSIYNKLEMEDIVEDQKKAGDYQAKNALAKLHFLQQEIKNLQKRMGKADEVSRLVKSQAEILNQKNPDDSFVEAQLPDVKELHDKLDQEIRDIEGRAAVFEKELYRLEEDKHLGPDSPEVAQERAALGSIGANLIQLKQETEKSAEVFDALHGKMNDAKAEQQSRKMP